MKIFRDRILSWMLKALREAKAHTSWPNPNIDYEKAAGNFVNALLQDSGKSHFLEDFTSFQRRVAFFGRFNSLSQTLLKLASPGVPDIYQGTELWDLSLVDPDNRRPVDFTNHRELLARLKSDLHKNSSRMVVFLHQLLEESQNGKIKLFTIYRALAFRRQHRELFERGNYIPLSVAGVHREHLCAFERSFKGRLVLAVVPRLVASFTNGTEMPPLGENLWEDTWLCVPKARPAESFLNLFTNETLRATERDGRVGLRVGEVLAHFPVALLTRIP
jgi:(1->4)-alpha-D-glucan 1-alpha-D-glucosylmutase